MKIVRIIARLNVGGPARHVVWLTEGLNGPECETVLVAGTVPSGEEDMSYFAAMHGVTPVFISQMSREISLKDLLTVWKLYRLFLRERPDVVHTHTAKAGTVGRVAGLLYRWLTPAALWGHPRSCSFVHTYHGHIFHGYYGRFKTRLFLGIERMLARLGTDRIVVVSEQQRREIHETFAVGKRDQLTVIPLGLDIRVYAGWRDRGKAFRDELSAKPDEILVGIVGRLTEIKNHDLFLQAVSIFKQTHQSPRQKVRFVVVGEGSLRKQLENQALSLGIFDDVVFVGNRNDAENFYPGLDVIALTSRNEGTPLTLIEAMANCRPVVATAVGGVVDLLGDSVVHNSSLPYVVCQRGIIVPPGNAEAFAAGLVRMIEDEKLRQATAARGLEYVVHRHSRERLLADVKALYNDLLKPSSTGLNFIESQRSVSR
jgi:glycosyltransferase involved in cell wall biosynthesis